MKNILLSLVATVLIGSLAFSQASPGSFYEISAGSSSRAYAMQAWSPWGTDSTLTVRSGAFRIADFDSLSIFVATSNANPNGTTNVNFRAVLEVSTLGAGHIPTNTAQSSFLSSANSYDSVAVACDTTTAKLKVFKYYATVYTKGAILGRLKLVPNNAVSTGNNTQGVVEFYIVGKKRGYQAPY